MARLKGPRRAITVALAAFVTLALATGAIAGHETGGVKSYTGCLVSGDGVLIKIKEGNAPKSACTGGQVEAHFSGGDVTSIAAQAGGGLTVGNGTNGTATVSIRRDCGNGDVVKWNGSAWACAADSNSTYTADGTTLNLSGGQFSIDPDYRVKNAPDCSSGQFATGFDSGGNIQCAAASANVQGFQAFQANFVSGDGVPDDGVIHPYVSLAVPAGTYLVTAKGVLVQGDDDVGFRPPDAFGCGIGNVPTLNTAFFGKDNEPDEYGFALTGIVTTAGPPLALTCSAANDLDLISVKYGTLVALKIG